jgi:small-conductance mechanosensitive channel
MPPGHAANRRPPPAIHSGPQAMIWKPYVVAMMGLAIMPASTVGQVAPADQPSRAEAPSSLSQSQSLGVAIAAAAQTARVAEQPATLRYANRSIVELRATVLSQPPSARAAAAAGRLDRLANQVPTSRVTTRAYDEGVVIGVGDHPVFVLMKADVDRLAGEELGTKAADAAARLQIAFDEAVELRTPVRLLTSVLLALGITTLYVAALWLLIRVNRRLAMRLTTAAERRLLNLPGGDIMVGVAHAPAHVRRAFTLASVLLGLLFTYAWLIAVLRHFPYTRPWGDSLRSGWRSVVVSGAGALVDYLPNIATVLAIVIATRFVARLAALVFEAVEQGRVTVPGIHPETAQPTRRILVTLLWLAALVMSYNYLPGSGSEAFKGVSVFVGLVVSLGSTGIMNQAMSGLMITYSRAIRRGDFVKVADIEGTVTHLGPLAVKIKNARNEQITIPNAIVVSHAATNYSRIAEGEGVFVPTSVTIGYDVPWRQVQALLLLAAERTPGVRREPRPVVLQAELQDFYVRYTLLVCLEQPHRRNLLLGALHANIQDAFNEYGVQIMSPNYEADPSGPKIVQPGRWYAAPAAAPPAPPSGAVAIHSIDEPTAEGVNRG